MNLGGTRSRGSSMSGQNTTELLLGELNKRLRELNKTLCCYTTSTGSTGTPDPDPDPDPVPFSFRYGVGTFPTTEAEILAGTVGTGVSGTAESVTYPNVTDDMLWMAEPVTEPVKTRWYNSILNQAPIGPDELFESPTVIGAWRLYISLYATTFTGAVEFRLL